MKKRIIEVVLSVIVLLLLLPVAGTKCFAATPGTTVLNGVDYSAIYNYQYYVEHNPDVAQAFHGDDVATLRHFVEAGMSEGRQAISTFDVRSYKLEYSDLRQAFGNNLKAYYLHYISSGKREGRIATGVTTLVGAVTKYGGIDYSDVYNYQYYIDHNPDVKQVFGDDDVATLNHFVMRGMIEGRQAISTFDVKSYRLKYPDLRQAFGNNLPAYYMHYISSGKKEGRIATGVTQRVGEISQLGGVDYSALYDYNYYVSNNPDVKQKFNEDDVAALNYFITYGMSQGQQAISTFDVKSYRLRYLDLRQAFGSNLKAYYLHYISSGKREGRIATGVTTLVGAVTKYGGIDYSDVYNYQYYIDHNPDVKQVFGDDDVATLGHFVMRGMLEGRQAISTFDVKSYRLKYPDLRQAFGNNLPAYYMHYISSGKKEGRIATGVTQLVGAVTKYGGVDYSDVYNYQYYIDHNPDVRRAFGDDDAATLRHFVEGGMTEGRQAISTFDVRSYRLKYPDLRQAFGNTLKAYYLHYISSGKKEGRIATGVTTLVWPVTTYGGVDYSKVYNYQYYIDHNLDVKLTFGDDDAATLKHFIMRGMIEARQATAEFNVLYYRCNYPDLQAAFGNNLMAYYMHYISSGKLEGRNAKELFHNYTGWFDNHGTKYYYENGSYCIGWKTIAGRNYYFSNTGVLSSRSGIDVSEWQGKIDWQAVKNDGIEFAMIRVGYGDDLTNQDDSTAAYNMSECERLGIPYGVYLYSYALNDNEARSEAAHVLRMLNGRHPSLGVFYDVEDTGYYTRHGLEPIANKAAINNFCSIFFNSITNAGYKAGIYSNYYYLNNVININNFPNNSLWLAWPSTGEYASGNWNIWQYTSGGSVVGISGRVDMDVLINR